MRRKTSSSNRRVDGILLLDKPPAMTSNAALQQVKRLFAAQKAGHTGSLDPIATGLLPICFGQATKFSQFLLNSDKSYRVVAKLGLSTATGDSEGEIVATHSVPDLTIESIDRYCDSLRGQIKQTPPMYSAIKYQGQPLYKLARQGVEVAREARQVTILSLAVVAYCSDNHLLTLDVQCSKGTYIRSLVEDLAKQIGCGGHVIELRRTAVGPYQSSAFVTVDEIKQTVSQASHTAADRYLLSINTALGHLPSIKLTPAMHFYLRHGRVVDLDASVIPDTEFVALALTNGELVGVGKVLDGARIKAERLVS